MIQIACPNCDLNLLLPDHLHGQSVPCPACKKSVDTSAAEIMPEVEPVEENPTRSPREPEREDTDRKPSREPTRDRDPEEKKPGPRGPATGAARVLLISAASLGLIGGVILLGFNLVQLATMNRAGVRSNYLVGMVFGSMVALVINTLPAIFQFIGASCLARLHNYGLVMTAAVMSLVFGLFQTMFCGLGNMLILAADYNHLDDEHVMFRLLTVGVMLVAGLINLIAGGVTLATLNSTPVVRAYDPPEERRRGRESDDEYDRYRDRDLRWRRRMTD